MATSWPQESSWHNRYREHANQLAKHLHDTQKCMDRSQSPTVPASHVRTIIVGTISLIAKYKNLPDLSSLEEKLNIMQAESMASTKETKEALESMKAEVKNTAAGIEKTISAGESAATAAREAKDVGMKVAGIAREIKNKGPQANTGLPMSYAAAAMNGAPASSIHLTQNAKTSPAEVQREVVVNIRDALTVQNMRALNPRSLRSHIERALEQSGNEDIVRTKIMSANQLKSGDLSIRTATNLEAQNLQKHADSWASLIGRGASIRSPTYGVLAHRIRTRSMDMARFEENRSNILQENRPFIPKAEIKYMGWLTRQAPSKSASSVIIEFTKPEDANKIIDEGLVWQGELIQCERYDRLCRLKQCFNCQKYGHIGTQCKATTACGYCAQEHNSRDCPAKAERTGSRKCAMCHGEHEAWSQQCPTRKEEMVRTKAAYASRARYHPVLAVQGQMAPPMATTSSLRRKRSARDLGQQPETETTGGSQPVRGHKRTNTGVVSTPTDKENEAPGGRSFQRPQRVVSLSRRALEALESNLCARTGSQQMDIDADSDS